MTENLVVQYSALREACGLWRDPARAVLSLTGEDRVRLLNGLVTCEVKDLSPGQGVRGFLTDVRGHILADVVIRASENRLWLDLPAPEISSIAAHIEKYIVVDRVEVRYAEDRQALTLVGPGSISVLSPLLDGGAVPSSPWSHVEAVLRGHETLLVADGHFGIVALTLWSSPASIEELRQGLLATRSSPGFLEVSAAAIEVLQVEEGVPRFGIDFGPENLPQETGLEDTVSYSKGCYLGQEVVARLHHRGQAARRLCRLQAVSDELPEIGGRLLLDGRQAGTVTSAVRSPIGDRVSALAMVQRRAADVGTELLLDGGGRMRVV